MICLRLLPIFLLASMLAFTASGQSRIETWSLKSQNFEGNLIGVSSERPVQVYLPEGYDTSDQLYPVLYALHGFFEREDALFDHYDLDGFLDLAISEGRLPPVIVVVSDYSTKPAGSFYTNSPVTGNWVTFIVEELVPAIDGKYRTLASRNSRGIFGQHIGGYGAIRIASRHPDVFGSVYALHPVATGLGHVRRTLPNWQVLFDATSMDDFEGDWVAGIFTAMYQAHLPDPTNPPLYFKPYVEKVGDSFVTNPEVYAVFESRFYLEAEIPQYATALMSLKGLKFDWGRHDPNQDHVVSNEHYTRKLRQYGIEHEAEEYNGGWGDRDFVTGGRVDTDLFPFFRENLETQ